MRVLHTPFRSNTRLAFSPDGRRLASAGNAPGVAVWSLPAGGEPALLLTRVRGIHSIAFSPDGRAVYAAARSFGVWRAYLDTGRAVRVIAAESPPRLAVVSPSAERVVTGSIFAQGYPGQFTLNSLRLAAGPPELEWTRSVGGVVTGVAFAPDGGRVMYATGTYRLAPVVVLDAATGGVLARVNHRGDLSGRITASPDGDRVAWLCAAGLEVRAVAGGESAVYPHADPYRLTDAAFHPSGRLLGVTCNDKAVRLLDPLTLAEVRSLGWQAGKLRSVAFSPDGTLAAAGTSGRHVVVWDVDV